MCKTTILQPSSRAFKCYFKLFNWRQFPPSKLHYEDWIIRSHCHGWHLIIYPNTVNKIYIKVILLIKKYTISFTLACHSWMKFIHAHLICIHHLIYCSFMNFIHEYLIFIHNGWDLLILYISSIIVHISSNGWSSCITIHISCTIFFFPSSLIYI